MKRIYNNTNAKPFLITTILFFLFTAIALIGTSCERYEPQPIPTNPIPSNPLEDLPWLKAKVNEFTSLSQHGDTVSVYIYQCSYRDNDTGFLIDEGGIETFYNYSGEVLCTTNEDTGKTCLELNIVRKKLIWELNKCDCGCSFASLQNVTWKFICMVDVQTGVITEIPAAKKCEKCCTLQFDTVSDLFYPGPFEHFEVFIEFPIYFSGISMINKIDGVIDTSSCCIGLATGTKAGEPTIMYRDALVSAQSISLQGYSLKFYYNNKQNYLLYKPFRHE